MLVLITGASSGFGEATAKLLASKGHKLILIARRIEKLEAIAKELNTPTFVSQVDVSNKKEVSDFFGKLPADFRDVDVLVNNAGLSRGLDPAFDCNLEDWEEMVDVNIKGLLYLTSMTLDLMKVRSTGLILNIGSVAATVPYRGGNVYGATKAFVRQFSRNLRTDLVGTGIKVTNIEPGMAETEFSVVRFRGDDEKAKKVYEGMNPLTANDIANTISWVIEQPKHVNIDNVEIMPLDQTFGGMVVNRK